MTSDSTADTLDHIATVQQYLNQIICELTIRAAHHDESKLVEPEKSAFDRATPALQQSPYGTPSYEAAKALLGNALQHHSVHHRHHPEYHPHGIRDMNLIDLIEMLCDWKAATLRHVDGDIRQFLAVNQRRFDVDADLVAIMKNTIRDLEW